MYSCTHCDAQATKWSGRCATCGQWGTLKDEGEGSAPRRQSEDAKPAEIVTLGSGVAEAKRIPTGVGECDRVLGGGFVEGSLVLLSGEPGIGKSTLAAMIGQSLGQATPILYASGEESAGQLSGRLKRLSCTLDRFHFVGDTNVEAIAARIKKDRPPLAIVDSVQTLTSNEADSAAGGATLVRYATGVLAETAKQTNTPILLIGQVTKDGSVAGPKTLEHLVDVVIILEGESGHAVRILRASKNRFGSIEEVGVFEMQGSGLVGVENPSAYFLQERSTASGSVVTAALEGSRVFLVEVQALVEKSVFTNPIRRASGFEEKRLLMLCAILSRRAGLRLADQDVYVNVVGGLSLTEPAADLAVCAAILGAMDKLTLDAHTVVFGEVGLGGEVRRVSGAERREKEAKRLGFETIMTSPKIQTISSLLEM